tara:strand:- start:112 stop:984 length:873 start_codon:yes stop_codon:yes gene_type:complete
LTDIARWFYTVRTTVLPVDSTTMAWRAFQNGKIERAIGLALQADERAAPEKLQVFRKPETESKEELRARKKAKKAILDELGEVVWRATAAGQSTKLGDYTFDRFKEQHRTELSRWLRGRAKGRRAQIDWRPELTEEDRTWGRCARVGPGTHRARPTRAPPPQVPAQVRLQRGPGVAMGRVLLGAAGRPPALSGSLALWLTRFPCRSSSALLKPTTSLAPIACGCGNTAVGCVTAAPQRPTHAPRHDAAKAHPWGGRVQSLEKRQATIQVSGPGIFTALMTNAEGSVRAEI